MSFVMVHILRVLPCLLAALAGAFGKRSRVVPHLTPQVRPPLVGPTTRGVVLPADSARAPSAAARHVPSSSRTIVQRRALEGLVELVRPPVDSDQDAWEQRMRALPPRRLYREPEGGGKSERSRRPRVSLFPGLIVDVESKPWELSRQVARQLGRQPLGLGVFELAGVRNDTMPDLHVLANAKLIWTMESLPSAVTYVGHIADRLGDGLRRIRIFTRYPLPETSRKPESMFVKGSTSPQALKTALRESLKKNTPVSLECISKEALSVAVVTLEELYLSTRKEVVFTTTRHADEEIDRVVHRITVYQMQEEEEEAEDEQALETEVMTKARVPRMYSVTTVTAGSSVLRLSRQVAETLNPISSRVVDLQATDWDGSLDTVVDVVLSLPPWLDVTCQVSPRGPNGRQRVRIVRDYPFAALSSDYETARLYVSASMLPWELASEISKSARGKSIAQVVAAGSGSKAVVLQALEILHFTRAQAVYFKLARFVDDEADSDIQGSADAVEFIVARF